MKEALRYWRNLDKQTKADIMAKNNIKVMTFEAICLLYESQLRNNSNIL